MMPKIQISRFHRGATPSNNKPPATPRVLPVEICHFLQLIFFFNGKRVELRRLGGESGPVGGDGVSQATFQSLSTQSSG